jgi:hypothetical protein
MAAACPGSHIAVVLSKNADSGGMHDTLFGVT